MPFIITPPLIDSAFIAKRDRAIAAARVNFASCRNHFKDLRTHLQSVASKKAATESIDRRRRESNGQPRTYASHEPPASKAKSKHCLRTHRVELAIVTLVARSKGDEMTRPLGVGRPAEQRRMAALQVVVVAALVLDPDASAWLGDVTDLAASPWEGASGGRLQICQTWGAEALAMLTEALDILGWMPKSASAPKEGVPAATTADAGWVERRMGEFLALAGRLQLTASITRYDAGVKMPGPPLAGMRNRAGGDGLRSFTWQASWRNLRHLKFEGDAPCWFENNVMVRCPESKCPKPWAWFDPDHPDGEKGTVEVIGPDDDYRRYSDLAATTWRSLVSAPLTDDVRSLVTRTQLVETPTWDDGAHANRWTMFLFLVAWSANRPSALEAKRWAWIPGTASRIEADGVRLPAETAKSIDDAALDLLKIDRAKVPTTFGHFFADLKPGLFTASAEVLGWLSAQKQPDVTAQSANAGETGKPHKSKDAYLSESDLAAKFDVSQDALRSRLRAWRPKHMGNDWHRVPNPRPRDPRFLYRVSSVMPVIEALKSTGEPPAKKISKK